MRDLGFQPASLELRLTLLCLLEFLHPHYKPHSSNYEGSCSNRIAYAEWQSECSLRHSEERCTYTGHEQSRYECDDIGLLFACKINGDAPQCEYRQRLVGPSEVLPYRVEAVGIADLPDKQGERRYEQRNADVQTVCLWELVDLQSLRNDESCRAESRVAARDRSSHNAQYCQYSAQHTEPVVAHKIDNHRC